MQREIDEILDNLDEVLPEAIKTNNERRIAESLKPTFENVTREFVTNTMYNILFDDELPNFRFDFREDEAIDFIEEIIKNYRYRKEKLQQVLGCIKKRTDENQSQPVMIISDYRLFFELLRQVYEEDINLFFKRIEVSTFPEYEMKNFLKQIWLRATPEDFDNPENFLRTQAQMLKDKTFERYDKEKALGQLSFLDNNILCVKNGVARTWDENLREMEFIIYDKNYYSNPQLFWKPHYTLPVIRYGIYEKDGKRICRIGSIQNSFKEEEKNDGNIEKRIERRKYKLNANIPQQDTEKIEPKNILALSIFVSLLNKEGIDEIEASGMYVLDYEYHQKRSKKLIEDFNKEWTKQKIGMDPEGFMWVVNYMKRNCEKEDLISEIKSERLIRTITRLLHHYPKCEVRSYPGEGDSFLRLKTPLIQNNDQINGDMLREIYSLINNREQFEER